METTNRLGTIAISALVCLNAGCSNALDPNDVVEARVSALTSTDLPTYHGGPLLNPEIVTLFWGNMAQADIDTMKSFLAGLATYMSGGTSAPGQEPVLFQYGVYGASIGASVTDTVLPASGHVNSAAIKTRVAQWQGLGYLPPFGPERLFVVFTQGIIIDDMGAANADHSAWATGQYFARVPFEKKLSGKTMTVSRQIGASHEIFEASTDPLPETGWVGTTSGAHEIVDPCKVAFDAQPFGAVAKAVDKASSTCSIWTGQHLSQISAVSWGNDRLDLFALGANRDVLHKYWDTRWHPSTTDWESLGGNMTSPPVAVSWGPGRLDIFARGPDGSCVHKFGDGTSFFPADWESLGGFIIGPPAAYSSAANRLDVIHFGMDGRYWHKFFDGGTGTGWVPSFTGWNQIPGPTMVGPPTLSQFDPGAVVAFGRGIDGAVLQDIWSPTNNNWRGWISLGGGDPGGHHFIGPVAAAHLGTRTDLFGLIEDNSYLHNVTTGGNWSGWGVMGGGFHGPASDALWGNGQLEAFGQQALDDTYALKEWNGSAWIPSTTGWNGFVGVLSSAPKVVRMVDTRNGDGVVVVGRGLDGAAYMKQFTTGLGWTPDDWFGLGGSLH